MQVLTTSSGRDLEYLEVGDPRGLPVLYLHGTPATAGSAVLLDDVALRHGVRLFGFSRPGYGTSTTTAPGLLSVGEDVDAVMGAHGVESFSVLGVSGGGPFALATAAAMPGRVRQVLVAAGPGPLHALAAEELRADEERALTALAAGEVDTAAAILTAEAQQDLDGLRRLPRKEFAHALRRMAPPAERYFDTRPADHEIFAADFRRAIERYDGIVRDNLSWLGPWDFEVDDVVASVHLFYGGADAMVPAANGEWLAEQLPRASLTVVPDAGHGDISFGSGERIFAALDRAS